MKSKFRLFFILTVITALLHAYGAKAQSGILKGKVIDEKTKEPIPFASVVIEKNRKQIGGTMADFDGNYIIKPLPTGFYDMRTCRVGYNSLFIKDIEIKSDSTSYFDFNLNEKPSPIDYSPILWRIPLISKDPAPSGQTFTSEDIKRMPW